MITPVADPDRYRGDFSAWWRQYTAGPAFWEKRPDYPPLVENYLRAMLAKRLNLPLPGPPQSETWLDQFTKDLGLTMGTEGLRINYQREQFLGPAASPRGRRSVAAFADPNARARDARGALATCRSSRLPSACRPSASMSGSAVLPISSGSKTRWPSGGAI